MPDSEDEVIVIALGGVMKGMIEVGKPKAEIKKAFEGFKDKFHFNSTESFDIFIDECVARQSFIPIREFINHCAEVGATEGTPREKVDPIAKWLAHLVTRS